jgi:hypothetical protein
VSATNTRRLARLLDGKLAEPVFAHKLPDCIDTPENRRFCILASMIGMSRAVAEIIEADHPLLTAHLNRLADEAAAINQEIPS